MTSERRRHILYEEAKQVFSDESADELMSYLPPVGWADVATKADLGMIRSEMDAQRAELRAELANGMDRMRAWTVTTMIAMTGLFAAVMFGLLQLTR